MELSFRRVSVIGLGYIGLPTSAVLAARGVEVIGVDVNPAVIATLMSGRIHILEPELDMVVRSAIQAKRLLPVLKPEPAEAFVIAVPTPFRDEHKPDLSLVEAAARSIAPVLARGNLVILESTSPVGTTQKLAEWLAAERPDLSFPHQIGDRADVAVAYCPERVLPGQAMRELVNNDRVIGGMSKVSGERARALYEIFVAARCHMTDSRTAEMVKLTENAFRDVNIAFANELSLVCDQLDINVWELIRLANRHPRVKILQPGPGVGGHCIAIDPWFIVDSAPSEARLIRTAREVNDSKPRFILQKIRTALNGRAHAGVACLGLSFKADIDDLRESPALDIVRDLADEHRGPILIAEPHILELPAVLRESTNLRLMRADEAIEKADIVVLLVNHSAFGALDQARLAGKTVIDTRGMWQ